jgi:hypothetical protein
MDIGVAHIRTLVSMKKIHIYLSRNVLFHRCTICVRP